MLYSIIHDSGQGRVLEKNLTQTEVEFALNELLQTFPPDELILLVEISFECEKIRNFGVDEDIDLGYEVIKIDFSE